MQYNLVNSISNENIVIMINVIKEHYPILQKVLQVGYPMLRSTTFYTNCPVIARWPLDGRRERYMVGGWAEEGRKERRTNDRTTL